MTDVYLLHFDKPYWESGTRQKGVKAPCTHYVGFAYYGVENRIRKHIEGNGSLLVAFAIKQGCTFTVERVEHFESVSAAKVREWHIKNGGHFSRLCRKCSGGKAQPRLLDINKLVAELFAERG